MAKITGLFSARRLADFARETQKEFIRRKIAPYEDLLKSIDVVRWDQLVRQGIGLTELPELKRVPLEKLQPAVRFFALDSTDVAAIAHEHNPALGEWLRRPYVVRYWRQQRDKLRRIITGG